MTLMFLLIVLFYVDIAGDADVGIDDVGCCLMLMLLFFLFVVTMMFVMMMMMIMKLMSIMLIMLILGFISRVFCIHWHNILI
jgi:hypothetical protein